MRLDLRPGAPSCRSLGGRQLSRGTWKLGAGEEAGPGAEEVERLSLFGKLRTGPESLLQAWGPLSQDSPHLGEPLSTSAMSPGADFSQKQGPWQALERAAEAWRRVPPQSSTGRRAGGERAGPPRRRRLQTVEHLGKENGD